MLNNNDTFLIIKTNSYTGNFEHELMAFVFGIYDREDEENVSDELNSFYSALKQSSLYDEFDLEDSPFYKYIDSSYFGRSYSEYTSYRIISHPDNDKYNCDSILIATNNFNNNGLPKPYHDFMMSRLAEFPSYISNNIIYLKDNIKILDVNYYSLQFNKKSFF